MYYHFRKTHKKYKSFTKPEECHFCDPHKYAKRLVLETKLAYVMENRTPYDLWELRDVLDHLMVIPKRHVLSLNDLTAAERDEIMKIIGDYEGHGYDVYARSPKSVSRSVDHQHTHLIKTASRRGRAMLYLDKPYIVWRIK